ncbi:hypothetical protein [Natrinema salinisoli]|uniref:hypothetical protein n=1 Tax=Natrinema salinisoli TaxID=2878535 RepID=UPI001CF039E0|nr:hypothetical protein [Natrinema salinisoli]
MVVPLYLFVIITRSKVRLTVPVLVLALVRAPQPVVNGVTALGTETLTVVGVPTNSLTAVRHESRFLIVSTDTERRFTAV